MTSLAPTLNLDEQVTLIPSAPFVDRRVKRGAAEMPGRERRQFSNSHAELSSPAMELAQAIDSYKLTHRRRFIDFDEMLSIIESLGYHK